MCGDLGTHFSPVVNLLFNSVKWAVRAWAEILQLLDGTGHRIPLPWCSTEQAHGDERDQNEQNRLEPGSAQAVAITAHPP